MKPEEAIKIIEYYYPKRKRFTCGIRIDVNDTECTFGRALTVAMQALKEIQQYREIGTVEECREAMEKQKAKKPKDSLKINPVIDGNGAYVDADTTIYLLCPNCEELVGIEENCDNYCRECGQKIDGENLEETEDVEGEMHTCKIQSKEKGAGNC